MASILKNWHLWFIPETLTKQVYSSIPIFTDQSLMKSFKGSSSNKKTDAVTSAKPRQKDDFESALDSDSSIKSAGGRSKKRMSVGMYCKCLSVVFC